MPFLWLPAPPPPTPPAMTQIQTPSQKVFDDRLRVSGEIRETDLVRKIETYERGVVAKFDVTTVTADRLELHYAEGEKYGIARGNVHLDDPEGTVDADYIIFWWGPNKGPDGQIAVADNVRLRIGNIVMSADYLTIKPERWEIVNAEGTNCLRPLPLYSVRSRRVVLVPGRQGTIQAPKLSIFGKELFTLPTRRFSLDKRNEGIQLPSVSYRQGSGLGVSWGSSILLGEQNVAQGSFSSFPRELPTYSVGYAHSFLDAKLSDAKIMARSDLIERFAWSYFDDVRVGNPETGASFASKPRNALSVQSIWNAGTSARLDHERLSKAIDVAYERSGPFANGGLFWQARAQVARRRDEPFRTRGILAATYQMPSWQLGRGVKTDVRFDVSGLLGERGAFGWARAQLGVIYRPIPQITFGAAYVAAGEGGRPDFIADRLYSRNAAHLRGDLNLGPTKLSYLAKYDIDRKGWYDREFTVSQVVGCLEPFITRRVFPRDYIVGVRLRLNEFLEPLQRRNQKRTAERKTQVISGPAPKQ